MQGQRLPSEPERTSGAISPRVARSSQKPPRTHTPAASLSAAGEGTGERASLAPRSRFPVHKVARAVLNVWRGADITDALAATGIPRQTWYVWLQAADGQRYDDAPVSSDLQTFAARCRHAFGRAQGLRTVRMQRLMAGAAKSSVGTLDWRAAHEHLKHAAATRARWHEYREVRVMQSGQVDHRHRLIEQASYQELVEALPAEWRELVEPVKRLPEHATGDYPVAE